GIAVQLGVDAIAGGRVLAQQQLGGLPVLGSEIHFEQRWRQPIRSQVGGVLIHYPFRIQVRRRAGDGRDRGRVGIQHLRGGDLPVPAVVESDRGRFTGTALNVDLFYLIFLDRQNLDGFVIRG